MVIEIFHWLWLAILLGAAVALRTTAGWRLSVARHTAFLVDFTILAVIVELTWRVASPATAPPLASWAAALFILSMALTGLDRHWSPAELPSRNSGSGDGARDEAPDAEDPFRAVSEARGWTPARARLCLEQTTEAIAVVDLEGELTWVNAAWARLHGYRALEVQGHHLSLFHQPGQMRERIAPGLEEARRTGSWKGEVEHRARDGSRFTTRLSLSLLHEGGGDPMGYVAVARGAEPPSSSEPAQHRAAAVAEPEAETLRVLVGGVAHEFNNLLTGILGNASLVSQQPLPGVTDEIQDIEASARRAAELSRLLQAYSGRTHPTTDLLDLNEVVRASSETLEGAAGGRSALSFELTADLPAVSADPEQILLLTRNLVANAHDAAGTEGCKITIRTGSTSLAQEDVNRLLGGAAGLRGPGRYVFLEVADQGHGMDEDARARMFEPFFSTRPGRRGLGLTAVAGIVRSHRGGIEAESVPGHGTRVRVYFPASETGRARETAVVITSAPAPPAAEARESPAADGTILVIDNEKIIRDLATGILSKQGFSVLTAADGEPGLALYRRHGDAIRAVLLDLSMPLMGGEECYRELRSIDPGARVILMTGHDTKEVRKSFDDGGLAGVLQKPFKPEELLTTLRAVLA